MKLEPLRSLQSKLSIAFLALAAIVLGSCGGGGATSSPITAGTLSLTPSASTFYAGVPYTLNIVGGRKPYLVTSNEQTLVALNFTTEDSQFTIVPNNPGVVNVGLDPNEVPRRTVTIQVRDSNGASISNEYSVLQNFFTGYGEFYSSTCPPDSEGNVVSACSGTDTIVSFTPVSNGVLYANRDFIFDRTRGDYSFVVEDPNVTPQLVSQIRVRTDSTGRARVRIRVTNNATTQIATYRVTDVLSGAMTNAAFTIVQIVEPSTIAPITILPGTTITLTGATTLQCGSGSSDVFVYGGVPPYTITATTPIIVSPTVLANAGDRLTITVPAGQTTCRSGGGVIVTDSRGTTALITVNSVAGTVAVPAPPPITIVPAAISTLPCGMSAQATVIGGSGIGGVTSTHPRISAIVSGTTLTLTRLTGDPAVLFPTTGTVVLTDGATAASIVVTATPANCP